MLTIGFSFITAAEIFLNKESVFEIKPIFPEKLAPHTLKYLRIA